MSKSAAKAQPKPLNDGVKCPACDGEGKVAILHDENSYNTCGICEGKGTLTKEGLDGYKAFFKEGI